RALLTAGTIEYDYFDGSFPDANGYTYSWAGTENNSVSLREYATEDVAPIVDPDCDPIPTPPTVPVIDDSCVDEVNDWLRHWVVLGVDGQPALSRWSQTDVVTQITSGDSAFRQLRIRY